MISNLFFKLNFFNSIWLGLMIIIFFSDGFNEYELFFKYIKDVDIQNNARASFYTILLLFNFFIFCLNFYTALKSKKTISIFFTLFYFMYYDFSGFSYYTFTRIIFSSINKLASIHI
jgi:hypothetical protein